MTGLITNNVRDIFVLECKEPDLKKYENLTIGEIATSENKHPVDAMLDIACADGLNTDFYTPPINVRVDYMKEMVTSHWNGDLRRVRWRRAYQVLHRRALPDRSADQVRARQRYPAARRAPFPPERPSCDVRRIQESRHAGRGQLGRYRGLRSRQVSRSSRWKSCTTSRAANGAACSAPRATRPIMVNGEVTFEDNKCTGATPGRLLRHGG